MTVQVQVLSMCVFPLLDYSRGPLLLQPVSRASSLTMTMRKVEENGNGRREGGLYFRPVTFTISIKNGESGAESNELFNVHLCSSGCGFAVCQSRTDYPTFVSMLVLETSF